MMTAANWALGRKRAAMTQAQAAGALRISQPYLSQLEKGTRGATPDLARKAMTLYRLPATVLPVSPPEGDATAQPAVLEKELAVLGYPGFAHVKSKSARNPAEVLLSAIVQSDLDARLVEALPWVLGAYPEINWPWLRDQVKLRNAQNRLGYIVYLAKETGASPKSGTEPARFRSWEGDLEAARLAREGTLCRDSMPRPERAWLRSHRPTAAAHWNLLTGLTPEQLPYACR
jgi:transcriptional regulator with XRE-family HTH domain